MFKSLFFSALMVLGMQTAQARSLMPRCAPVIDMQPSRLNCVKETVVSLAGNKSETLRVFYSIVINTKASPVVCMETDQYVEVKRATISVSTNELGQAGTIELLPNQFEYQLGGATKGSFSAPLIGLDLNDCVSPVHGGFSVGN